MNREQRRQALKRFLQDTHHHRTPSIDFEIARIAFNRRHYQEVETFLQHLPPPILQSKQAEDE